MDTLTAVALIGFLAQVVIWFVLPENGQSEIVHAPLTKPEAIAA